MAEPVACQDKRNIFKVLEKGNSHTAIDPKGMVGMGKRYRSPISKIASTWLKYCRYGVNLYPINQSINQKLPDKFKCIL